MFDIIHGQSHEADAHSSSKNRKCRSPDELRETIDQCCNERCGIEDREEDKRRTHDPQKLGHLKNAEGEEEQGEV